MGYWQPAEYWVAVQVMADYPQDLVQLRLFYQTWDGRWLTWEQW